MPLLNKNLFVLSLSLHSAQNVFLFKPKASVIREGRVKQLSLRARFHSNANDIWLAVYPEGR